MSSPAFRRQVRIYRLKRLCSVLWARACLFDGVDPGNRIVEFSAGNPHVRHYERAVILLQRELNPYANAVRIGVN